MTTQTLSDSGNVTVLTVNETNASCTATQAAYMHSANGAQPYVLFVENGANGILGKVYGAGTGSIGQSTGNNGTGVYGLAQGGSSAGVVGLGDLSNGYGVRGTGYYGVFSYGNGYSFYGQGPGYFTGYLTKGGGGFQVDHPLDPENRYLNHGFVESPVMTNHYRGKVTLDANGETNVCLPSYYEAVNADGTVMLTAIGASMPDLYASEIVSGIFTIQGGVPFGRVNWVVDADRSDAWTKKNSIPTESYKPAHHKGKYMHPELYGKGEEHSVHPKPKGPVLIDPVLP